jgi:hypothetical protein
MGSGCDPLILKRAFDAVDPVEIEKRVQAAPTGALARRLWFLYESMTGRTLDRDNSFELSL